MSIWLGEARCFCRPTFPFLAAVGTNDQTHAAVIKMSSLDLAGNKAGFLPAVPGFLIIARRSYSSNNFPYVVLGGWLSSIFVVQIAGGGRSPLTFPPQLALPPQSQNVLVCRFPGRGSAHCDFSTTALGDNIHLFLKIKVTFWLALYWYLSSWVNRSRNCTTLVETLKGSVLSGQG